MEKPVVASPKPFLVTLPKAGRTYFWCACGRSKKQPFCDGSHAGTDIEPVAFKAKSDGQEVLLCGCKQTKAGPMCDGSHNGLDDGYALASEAERAATAHIETTPFDATGKTALDGGCYVKRLTDGDYDLLGNWRVAQPIGGTDGARHLSQWQLQSTGGSTDVIGFSGSAAALFVLEGAGNLTISGQHYRVQPESGLYVAPGEGFSLQADTLDMLIHLIAIVCPVGPAPSLMDAMPGNFTGGLPERLVNTDASARTAMADRFYQVLVGDESGGPIEVTEFIGEIPESRAAFHRHMYEEAITILSGEGFLWTEGSRAAVQPGDVIFLPKKQLHSLECTDPKGMRLMGAFYPSGSPAINY